MSSIERATVRSNDDHSKDAEGLSSLLLLRLLTLIRTPDAWSVFLKVPSFLVIAIYASLPARAQPSSTVRDMLANGTWTVQGREIPGTRCGHWLIRLTNLQGRRSGVVSLARGSVPLKNLTLMPDGSFSGSTQPAVVGSSFARAYKVSGRFSGDTVHLTLENDICPARHGVAIRGR